MAAKYFSIIEEMNNDPAKKADNHLTLTGYSLECEIFIKMLKSIKYLHECDPKVIHGNLKPENILLRKINSNI